MVVIILFTFVFKIVTISGDSMKNTLKNQERIVISNLFYEPKNGDIIVISRNSSNSTQNLKNETCIIKRIIATEGQVVNINFDTGIVFVDGKALMETYTLTATNLEEGMSFPLVVEEGCVFVMGDNRNNSKDSRSIEIGLIDCREILGKAIFLLVPGTNKGAVNRDILRIGALT